MTSGAAAVGQISSRLRERYPDAAYALVWRNPVELLVATILAAQATDERVNRLTATLFAKYPTARAFAEADPARLPQEDWLWWPAALILHGRETCTAKAPACDGCMFADLCPRVGVR